ncbi:hypothetical protein F5Y05DRAFT_397761 [Hypoxylon sp. FL0543]|nr:hypothetical protein F5Y05DRAFT_397761 [Hypoxylon sp. FL0543]
MRFEKNGTSEVDIVVEVGTRSTISSLFCQILKSHEVPHIPCLQESVDAVETMQSLACDLLNRGYPVSISGVNFLTGGYCTFLHDLPTYPLNHKRRLWTESRMSREAPQLSGFK